MENKSKSFFCIASGVVLGASICYWLKHKKLRKSKK